MYSVEHYMTALPQMEIFGRTAKYINHPDIMPDMYKESEKVELHDKQITQVHRMIQLPPMLLFMTTTCIQG